MIKMEKHGAMEDDTISPRPHPPSRRLKRFTGWIRKLDRHSTVDYDPPGE
jgi:hypothetical protein